LTGHFRKKIKKFGFGGVRGFYAVISTGGYKEEFRVYFRPGSGGCGRRGAIMKNENQRKWKKSGEIKRIFF